MGQGQAKKAVRNRQRAVVAGPPLGIEGGDFVKVKVSSGTEEESNLNDAIRAFPIGAKEYCGLEVDPKHLGFPIVQPYVRPELKAELQTIHSIEMLECLKDKTVDWNSILLHGVGYGGEQQFSSVENVESYLKMLIDYAEDNASAAPDIRVKLRYVTKAVLQNKDSYGVLPMLATHGGVCNVMKEVGIRAAYGALASCSKDENDVSDVRNKLLQLLHDYRELRVEHLFLAQQQGGSGEVNTHSIIGYRNAMHEFIGLIRIPDPDCPDIAIAIEYVPSYFLRFYNVDSILNAVHFALNDRKLSYNAVVSFLQYNRPVRFTDAEDFLYHCFDDDGKFTRGAAAWLLFKCGVLQEVKKGCDDNALFPPLSEMELSRSRDNVLMRSSEPIVEDLVQSMGKEEVEDLLESADWAVSHVCDNCKSHLNFY